MNTIDTRNIRDMAEQAARRTARRPRLTKDQRKALEAYEFALRQEDRYMGSVFVNSYGQRKYEEKTRQAYERCKALGMTYEHGL